MKVRAPGTQLFHQVASGTTLRGALNDGALTHFDGSGLPFTGDFGAGFETSYAVSTNNGLSLAASLTSRLPRDHVTGAFFDLPSYSDLFFHAPTSDLEASQPMRRTAFEPGALEGYTIPGVAPLDDGFRDILWYNQTSGNIVIWYMDASVVRITGGFTSPAAVGSTAWRVVAVADYGKGPAGVLNTPDIVWQNDSSHRLVVWNMDFTGTRTFGSFTTPDTLLEGGTVFGPR